MAPLLITNSSSQSASRKLRAVLGVPGGPRIPNVVTQMTVQLLHFNANIAEAVAAPRVHCEGVEPVSVEKSLPAATIGALQQRGHEVRVVNQVGGLASGIVWNDTTRTMSGAADPRGAGVAMSAD
jgi:gamma-glutamyltranspeptidase/glutathione hydrolase